VITELTFQNTQPVPLESNSDSNGQSKGDIKVLGSAGREWQLAALDELAGKQFSVLVAPCGSGKATAQVGLAIEDINQSDSPILQLFVVPQTHIAAGFFKANEKYSTLRIKDVDFSVRIRRHRNFCDKSYETVDRLINLLLTDRKKLASEGLSGLFAMATHAALRLAWNRMTEPQRTQAIQNLHIRIDESHHTMMDESESNQLGAICRYMIDSGYANAKLTLSTATDFRGDSKEPWHIEGDEKFQEDLTGYLNALAHYRSLRVIENRIDDTAKHKQAVAKAILAAERAVQRPDADKYKGVRKKKGCNGTDVMCETCATKYRERNPAEQMQGQTEGK